MNIPEFSIENLTHPPQWHDVADEASIPMKKAVRLEHEDKAMFVYRTHDEVRVYDSLCPHQVTNIPELAIHDTTLTCPKHGWKFDINTGACIEKGKHPLKRLEATIEGGRLQVRW
jgi:nitrite reductase/ring-hydroxylating ferredoxin subunit